MKIHKKSDIEVGALYKHSRFGESVVYMGCDFADPSYYTIESTKQLVIVFDDTSFNMVGYFVIDPFSKRSDKIDLWKEGFEKVSDKPTN
jgi:hypothetical protein